MAKSSGHTGLWLSSQHKVVVLDRMLSGDKENDRNGAKADSGSTICFPAEFPYEFDFFTESSALASPVESVQDSTETDSSDEEDFLVGLTPRLSQSSIPETQKHSVPVYACEKTKKNWSLAHSPQSTLTRMESWSARSVVSSEGSSNGPSQVPSPTSAPSFQKNDNWDVIYAAAGQVAKLKMKNEGPPSYVYQTSRLFSAPQVATQVFTAKGSNNMLYQAQTFAQSNQQQNQFNKQVRQDQILRQRCSTIWGRQAEVSWLLKQKQIQSRGQSNGYHSDYSVHSKCFPQSAWLPLQAHNATQPSLYCRSAIGGVPLAGSGAKRECAGTGVFLPRQYDGTSIEPRKKANCVTALPDSLVQTGRFDKEAAKGSRLTRCFASEHEALVMARSNAVLFHQRSLWRQDGAVNQEIRLPQEWTY